MKTKVWLVAALLLGFISGVAFWHWHFQRLCKPCINPVAGKTSSMTVSFTSTNKVVIAGATSKNVLVECYNSSAPPKMIIPGLVMVDPAFNVVVRFLRVTSGYCTVHNTK